MNAPAQDLLIFKPHPALPAQLVPTGTMALVEVYAIDPLQKNRVRSWKDVIGTHQATVPYPTVAKAEEHASSLVRAHEDNTHSYGCLVTHPNGEEVRYFGPNEPRRHDFAANVDAANRQNELSRCQTHFQD